MVYIQSVGRCVGIGGVYNSTLWPGIAGGAKLAIHIEREMKFPCWPPAPAD